MKNKAKKKTVNKLKLYVIICRLCVFVHMNGNQKAQTSAERQQRNEKSQKKNINPISKK